MPEEIDGKIYRSPEENDSPLSEEIKARMLEQVAEFNRIRDSYPADQLKHLPDKYGDEDRLGTPKEAEYLAEVEQRKCRGQYWG
ncbi:hypothetical protein [Nocardia brasiliensis]|uniref:hypothetical protein n=1 Tax=Nocardia brasiliensis TaxID=37326 RepID=UPI001895BFA3|nr:hypothetical protein [Nocardia brasiliensis]MBF6126592.1 hypothetical protein [Nocardia brasiliensis]